jgi:DNA-binding GntR family transcriptional regulator
MSNSRTDLAGSVFALSGREVTELGLHRETLASQIYAKLEGRILNGDMAPGTRLSEEGLAESFGVSRAPVREALMALQRIGLAERFGPRDRIIAVPTPSLIWQKYDLWWIVDAGRTYLASLEATPAQCDEMAALIDAMAIAVAQNDVAAYKGQCEAFHHAIRSGCKNPFVTELGAGADIHLRWFERLYDRNPEVSAAAVREHREILEAFRAKNFAALSESIRVHMLRQRDHILGLFEAMAVPPPRAGTLLS